MADDAESWEEMLKYGMEVIDFSPEDAKWFWDLAFDSRWDVTLEDYPVLGQKFREMLTK